MADIFAFGITVLKGREIGIGNFAIEVNRKDQRNVDVDALGESLPNGWKPFWGCRNLDQQVWAIQQLPETAHFRDGAPADLCRGGRNFETYEAVLPAWPVG